MALLKSGSLKKGWWLQTPELLLMLLLASLSSHPHSPGRGTPAPLTGPRSAGWSSGPAGPAEGRSTVRTLWDDLVPI